MLKTALFGAKLYHLATVSANPSFAHRSDHSHALDVITKDDLELRSSIAIAANAFCVTIVYHHEGKCYKVRPGYSIFPEPPKIHLFIKDPKLCILLYKASERESYYETIKSQVSEIAKKEEEVVELKTEVKKWNSERSNLESILKSRKIEKAKTEETKEKLNVLKGGFTEVLNDINEILEDRFINT